MPFSYANPTSGPSAGGIGWFNFNTFSTINPGQTITGLTGTLNDGTVVTFDLTAINVSGGARAFAATTVPTYVGAMFGTAGYTGLSGNVALDSTLTLVPSSNELIFSNIVVKDSLGNPVPNYTVIIADAESTGDNESWVWQTNGGNWNLLTKLGAQTSPTLSGLGTQTATLQGNGTSGVANAAFLLTTQNPTQLNLTTSVTTTAGGQEGIAIGFATTHVRLQKNVGDRIDPADQFVLNVAGTPGGSATTAGAATGIQPQAVNVFAIPGNAYTVSETMAPGSVSTLGDYYQVISAANATPAGSVPPGGNLPITFTPALGDDITYTVLNAAPEVFNKTVDKTYADVGEVLTYTITVDNPNDFAINNVLVTDATPAGTAYIGNLTVSQPYTGTDPASGLTITSIPANSSAVITYQVRVNTFPPIPNPVPNFANVVVPGGTSGMTNVVTTQVNTAFVSVLKTVDKAYAQPGDVLTYTLLLNNAGNVTADSVTIVDAIPAGTLLVPGSLTGATGTFPNLSLSNPIPAGGSATIIFQVKVNGVPAVNPIPNFASVAYDYTVDPADPDGKTGTRRSNTVTTLISTAKLTVVKAVDKHTAYLGDIITYQLAVKNTGSAPAIDVALTDLVTTGVSYVPGSLVVSAPYSGTPAALQLQDPIAPGETVSISFKARVDAMPSPNPVLNRATVSYRYTVDPQNPGGVTGTVVSNEVCTLVFRYNFNQQVTDVIQSVALEQAALAALANAEGAKIQRLVATGGATTQELLCLNKSVSDLLDSISILEAVLRQKLAILGCQISGCAQ